MKRDKVMNVLDISSSTVNRWLKEGKLQGKKLPSGHWDYDDDIVYRIANGNDNRKTVIYARVSTGKQKNDLQTQLDNLEKFCTAKGWNIDSKFSEIASGVTFDKRKSFFKLLDDIQMNKVKRVIITHKDRLSRVSFSLFENIFNHHGVEIVVLSDYEKDETDDKEIFEEIISLLHCFSMKKYSKRRKGIKKALDVVGDNTKTDTIKQRQT